MGSPEFRVIFLDGERAVGTGARREMGRQVDHQERQGKMRGI